MNEARFAELKALMLDIRDRGRDGAATARLAREHRQGRTGPLDWAPAGSAATTPAVEDDGMRFTHRAERIAEVEADHRARRRRADAEVATRERIHAGLTRMWGADAADRWMG